MRLERTELLPSVEVAAGDCAVSLLQLRGSATGAAGSVEDLAAAAEQRAAEDGADIFVTGPRFGHRNRSLALNQARGARSTRPS